MLEKTVTKASFNAGSDALHLWKNIHHNFRHRTSQCASIKISCSFFMVKSVTQTTHLEKLHMHFPSWRSPQPSLDIWSMEYHFHPNVRAFSVLLTASGVAKSRNNDGTYKTRLPIYRLFPLCEEVRSRRCECLTF